MIFYSDSFIIFEYGMWASWHGNTMRITGRLSGIVPSQKSSDAGFWCFLIISFCYTEQSVEPTVVLSVI